jgi:tRNA-2-methylthio-N6-dimethylallyladenosine synthase
MPDQVPKAVVQARYERLIALQEEISWDANRALVGTEVEVLVNTAEGRKDAAAGRVSGRARDGRLVHVAVDESQRLAAGDLITSVVTYAAPHHLVADAGVTSHRRWRGGEAAVVAQPSTRPLLTIGRRAE